MFLKPIAVLIALTLLICVMPAASAQEAGGTGLIPMGNTVGIKMLGDGVLVIGLSEIEQDSSKQAPAAEAGIRTGDIITHINADKICSIDEFKDAMTKCPDGAITVRLTRQEKQYQFTVTPAVNADNRREIGVWLRDGIAGIGTVTFLDPETGTFGALGHSISDIDTGTVLPMRSGSVMRSSVASVKKGESGSPGELRGNFDVFGSIGELNSNTEHGIFGVMHSPGDYSGSKCIPAANRSEIKVGKAVILSNVEGERVEEFEIEISRVYPQDNAGVRDMLVSVTDERLISVTGGIVQGMSGSPIIQNGKLVGALTHVLVNDPKKGYAIAIENMLKEAPALIASAFFNTVRIPGLSCISLHAFVVPETVLAIDI